MIITLENNIPNKFKDKHKLPIKEAIKIYE